MQLKWKNTLHNLALLHATSMKQTALPSNNDLFQPHFENKTSDIHLRLIRGATDWLLRL